MDFNPRPHEEGDTVRCICDCKVKISIHALTRRATSLASWLTIWTKFQSTPSRGGRPLLAFVAQQIINFNPRPHEEGDLIVSVRTTPRNGFQSTPSRGGRPVRLAPDYAFYQISIHALTRRATMRIITARQVHTDFNPRPHEEGDHPPQKSKKD